MAKSEEKLILLLDKESGMTSFEATDRARKILKAKKAGHTGTLDLKVSGLLVIGLDEATKAMPVLVGQDKGYEGEMELHGAAGEEEIKKVFREFTGAIKQTPPVRSRVKREERQRLIHNFNLVSLSGKKVRFKVLCEKGTYVRKLCHDVGERLGPGSHMVELRRTRVGPFRVEEATTLAALEEGQKKGLLCLEEALERSGLKRIKLKKEFVEKVRNGMAMEKSWAEEKPLKLGKGEMVGLFEGEKIIALGKAGENGKPVKVERVFLN